MPRPFRVPTGTTVSAAAAVLSLALALLYLPGMPAALAWPAQWLIVGLWWLVGLCCVLRLPKSHPVPTPNTGSKKPSGADCAPRSRDQGIQVKQ